MGFKSGGWYGLALRTVFSLSFLSHWRCLAVLNNGYLAQNNTFRQQSGLASFLFKKNDSIHLFSSLTDSFPAGAKTSAAEQPIRLQHVMYCHLNYAPKCFAHAQKCNSGGKFDHQKNCNGWRGFFVLV